MTRVPPGILAAAVLAGGAGGLAGCRSAPAADRIVYVVEPAASPAYDALAVAPPGPPERTDVSEDARRAWVVTNYGPRHVVVAEPAPDAVARERSVRRAPRVERITRARDRVVYVDREPRWYDYVPPVALGLAYRHGGHHRGGWSWGLDWNWPGCRW